MVFRHQHLLFFLLAFSLVLFPCFKMIQNNREETIRRLSKTWIQTSSYDPYLTIIKDPSPILFMDTVKNLTTLDLKSDNTFILVERGVDTFWGVWNINATNTKFGLAYLKSAYKVFDYTDIDYRDTILELTDSRLILGSRGGHGMVKNYYKTFNENW